MATFGIDVSKWQGDFDFEAALNEGWEFAVLKGGGGDDGLYVDGRFEENYNKTKKLKIPVGCYFFGYAKNGDEAKKEAEYFYENCLKGKKFTKFSLYGNKSPESASILLRKFVRRAV